MRKRLLAALLAALALTLPASASGGKIVYEQNFDSVADFAALDWDIVESLTSNTAKYSIESGQLLVDNIGGHDSYAVMVPEDVMRSVIAGDYTVQYDITLLEGGDTSRYLAVLLNYNRQTGKDYNSLHIRIRGSGDWQTRRNGEWITLDTAGVEGRPPINTGAGGQALAEAAVGVPYGDTALIGQKLHVRQEITAGAGVRIFINDVFVTGTDEKGWQDFMSIADPIQGASEIALKAGGSVKASFDNFVVATGIGIPEPEPETTAAPVTEAPVTEPAPETAPAKVPDIAVPASVYAGAALGLAAVVAVLVKKKKG